jgi:FtsP/CotA-like multicopper oxidase with cupredoxin domain
VRVEGDTVPTIDRRTLVTGAAAAGLVAVGGVAMSRATGSDGSGTIGPGSDAVRQAEAQRRTSGQRVVETSLTARRATVSLGGVVVPTWVYGDSVPGPLLRATAGDLLRVTLRNALPTDTTVHWHGVALRNDMDGVPGMTQDPIKARSRFTYEFTVPDPGTYFYHPHTGVQLDRGLYGVLVVDDPAEAGDYDEEWVVVVDDWVDGTGRTPDEIWERLQAQGADSMEGMDAGGGSMEGMEGMEGMGGMAEEMQSKLLGGAGDIDYPHYLVNGRTAGAPQTLSGKPGQRVRIRIVNAASDTAFRVALGGHRLTLTHSDGFAVRQETTDAVLIGMGERYDVVVTLRDGVFPLVASAEGKAGQGLAVVRTGAGRMPMPGVRVPELRRRVVLSSDLVAADAVTLSDKAPDRTIGMVLAGTMAPYRWTINGAIFDEADPLPLSEGERVRLRFENRSMMFHPMHVHGHTFGLVRGGARKDTVIVRPMETIEVDVEADNPGQWATHCHNIYHAEAGMMTTLSYVG